MAPIDEDPAGGEAAQWQRLRLLAVAQIDNGRLPRVDPSSVLAGPGQGEPCVLCGERIGASDISYEVTLIQADGKLESPCFHIACYNAWKQACMETGA